MLYSSDTSFHQKIIDCALDFQTLESLQALSILALAYLGSDQHRRAFGIVAILSRIARSMNLHILDAPQFANMRPSINLVLSKPTPTNATELEKRRRCFWGIYILDQFTSSSTGSPPHFPQKDIRVSLPCSEQDFQLSSPRPDGRRSLWSYCVESAGALGKVMEYLTTQRGPRDTSGFILAKEIEDWWKSLPEGIRTPENVDKSEVGKLVMLHTTYYTYPPPPLLTCKLIQCNDFNVWEFGVILSCGSSLSDCVSYYEFQRMA